MYILAEIRIDRLTIQKQRTYLLVSMAENEKAEVQDVVDEGDEL